MRRMLSTVFTALVISAATLLHAEEWPTQPITVVSPFVGGTTYDLVARIVLDSISAQLNQRIALENRPGGDGIVGVESVVKAKPDGQTLLLSTSAMTTATILHKTLPYDILRDLEPIAMFGGEPSMLVASPEKGYNKVSDLVAAAKTKPGQLKFASMGIGSASFIAGERFRLAADLDVQHVAFMGPEKALADLTAGRVDFFFLPITPALPLIREGKVIPLAVSMPERLQSLRGLQTLTEAGYPIATYLTWSGLSAPAKISRNIVDKLNAAITNALGLPAVRTKLLRIGIEPEPMSAQQYGVFISHDVAGLNELAKSAHVEPQN
jgi:tripartite-type tricarboxylate transporter receptor subunit TctC